eukprot:scaffold1199_cov253-Chaetoceros_neogracile.AAC.3
MGTPALKAISTKGRNGVEISDLEGHIAHYQVIIFRVRKLLSSAVGDLSDPPIAMNPVVVVIVIQQ